MKKTPIPPKDLKNYKSTPEEDLRLLEAIFGTDAEKLVKNRRKKLTEKEIEFLEKTQGFKVRPRNI